MARGRTRVLLLAAAGVAFLVWLAAQLTREALLEHLPANLAPRHHVALPPAGALSAAAHAGADNPPVSRTSQSFTQRLRCTQARFFYSRLAPPDVLALLCARKPLAVLKIEAPLAEAGDPHAIELVAFLADGGRCDLLTRPSTLHRAYVLEVAQKNGASAQTLQRLDDLLADEERGPSAEELEGCKASAAELAKLQPGILRRLTASLGRSVQALRGENELDVEIEYTRKMLVGGDTEGEEALARLLLEKGTRESQAEAMTLLREAARSSPSAKSTLAHCLVQGCPTPAPDPGEARQLLTEAATAGDLRALITLAGPADPNGADLDPNLPPPERYAWSQFLRRLHEEGCFGATDYSAWATFPGQAPDLLAMSPADAEAARKRAAELLADPLEATRSALGCD
jgi:hypothetical protein